MGVLSSIDDAESSVSWPSERRRGPARGTRADCLVELWA
jgi:hypothetical protein